MGLGGLYSPSSFKAGSGTGTKLNVPYPELSDVFVVGVAGVNGATGGGYALEIYEEEGAVFDTAR